MEENKRYKVDNPDRALERMIALYNSEDLCDIQLQVGHLTFNTHKLVLCMCSDVFKTMLTSSTWPESKSKSVVLQEDPECVKVFEAFLKYLYNGQVQFENANVLPLLTLADKYNIADLSKSCIQHMSAHCLPEARGCVVSWLQYAIMCGHEELEAICRNFITYNFEIVMFKQEFAELNEDILVQFLKSSDLVINDEYILYRNMRNWLLVNRSSSKANQCLFHKIMKHVRFPMMQLEHLALLDSDPIVAEYNEFFLKKIFSAIKYHTCRTQVDRFKLQRDVKSNKSHYQARNYTSETWSTQMMMTSENLSNMSTGDVRGAFFTTPVSCSEMDQNNHCDWHIHFYPKGVKFEPCIMIGVFNNLTIEGVTSDDIRLSVSTNCGPHEKRRVVITLLFTSTQGMLSEAFVSHAITETAIFDNNSPLFNFNNICPKTFADTDAYTIKIIIRPE